MAASSNVWNHDHGSGNAKIKIAGDMWVCDWRNICAWGHDWVGLGEKGWPNDTDDSDRHRNADRRRDHGGPPCRLGDPNWKNDCNR